MKIFLNVLNETRLSRACLSTEKYFILNTKTASIKIQFGSARTSRDICT